MIEHMEEDQLFRFEDCTLCPCILMVMTPIMYNPIHHRTVSDSKINSEGEYAMEDAEMVEPHFKMTKTRHHVLRKGLVENKIKQK